MQKKHKKGQARRKCAFPKLEVFTVFISYGLYSIYKLLKLT